MGKSATIARRLSRELVVTRDHVPTPEEVESARKLIAALTPQDEEDAIALAEVSETLIHLELRR